MTTGQPVLRTGEQSAATAATARFARGPLLGAIVVAFAWHVANNLPSTMARLSMFHSLGAALAQWALFALVGLLAGTVAEGKDPTVDAFALNLTGWILGTLPFVTVVVGWIVGLVRRTSENENAVRDIVS